MLSEHESYSEPNYPLYAWFEIDNFPLDPPKEETEQEKEKREEFEEALANLAVYYSIPENKPWGTPYDD